MILHVKFVAVTGRGDRELLQAYLYDSTKLVEYMDSGERFVAILRTEGPTDKRAQYLADYQAGRLQSGLLVARVSDDPLDSGQLADLFIEELRRLNDGE